MGIPVLSWESHAGCPQRGRLDFSGGIPLSRRPGVLRQRTENSPKRSALWGWEVVGGGQSAEVPRVFWTENPVLVSKSESSCPLEKKKKQGRKALGGKSSRRGSENWGERDAQSLSHLGGKLSSSGAWGRGGFPAKRPASSPAAPDLILLSPGSPEKLVPRTAARAHSSLCKVRSPYSPTKSTPTNYFADLSNTDEGHFNYITRERSPEAMSFFRADGRIAA